MESFEQRRDIFEEQDPEKKYILVVDDEDAIRLLLRDVLEDAEIDIYEAEDGEVALEYVKHKRVDLVISDLQMPGMSGVDLLEEIHRRFPSLPVLIITGKPTLDAAVDAMKGGAIDFLTKPFDIMEFREMVQNALADNERLKREQQESKRYHNLDKIGGYSICELLGEGTSGVVFRSEKDGKEFALKVFKFASVTETRREELRERFVRESEFLSKISHPNIVRVNEFGFSKEGIPYIVMEYVNGTSLKKHIKEMDLTIEQKLDIIRQVADALQFIHDKKIIHRDIKPDNILVTGPDMRVVLSDFGIIRMPDSNLTMAANIMGSPAYLAPEGFVSARVDWRCDIFSLGVVLYELLLGRRPFQADDLFSMAAVIQSDLPTRPSELDPCISDELEELLARVLKKEVDERLQTAGDFADYIDYLLNPKCSKPELPPLGSEPNWAD